MNLDIMSMEPGSSFLASRKLVKIKSQNRSRKGVTRGISLKSSWSFASTFGFLSFFLSFFLSWLFSCRDETSDSIVPRGPLKVRIK